MMKKETTHFRIKVAKPLAMSKAKKLVFVSNIPDGSSMYKTVSYDNRDDVFEYLKGLGCDPETVSRLSLQT